MIIWSAPIKLGTAQLLPLKSQHTIHSNCKFLLTPAKIGKGGGLAKLERKNNAIYAGGVAAEAGGRSFVFNKEFRGAREVTWYLLDFLVNFVNWSDF